MILKILLIFVQSVVLIDVFHIGCALVRRVIAFAARIGIGRISLRIVDVFVPS